MNEICDHIMEVVTLCRKKGIRIWSEHGEDGWVNIHCPVCFKTVETDILATNAAET